MRKLWIVALLAGCSAYPQVNWPAGPEGEAPPLRPLDELLLPGPVTDDAAGAALAAKAAALKARVAVGG